ncbi:sensor domain-containing diguanylate cyclase [Paenibacillus hexagrammi]|uniref:Diguanylate cyclase n=1 Tax=Paenibacillus hexagrammi TaxID=2908839 RepID=A0ABY3SJF3_9BACL|nr:sensor domain-containing diguanylate cyclase [Paenibacillus sp. YPD9-1]UJF33613.1 diguanylate cyclase [Paenibacillus sp. YPD9-1]
MYLKKPYMKVRLQALLISLLVFSMLGSTVILMGVAIKTQNETLTDSTLQSNFEGARNLNVTLNTLIDLMFRSLGEAARFIENQHIPIEKSEDDLEAMLGGHRFFHAVIAADQDGLVRAASRDSAGIIGTHIPSSILQAADHHKPTVSEPYHTADGRMAILFIHPLQAREASPQGWIGGIVFLQEKNIFSDIFHHAVMSKKNTYAYIVDKQGELLFHPDPSRIQDIVSRETLQENFIQKDVKYAEVVNAAGEHVLAGYLSIPNIGWGVVFQSPASSVHQAMTTLVKSQLSFIIPLFALFLLVSLWIARQVTRPFAILTAAARTIALGERLAAAPFRDHWNYEAHHLSKAMMKAVTGLQDQADHMAEQAMTDKLTGLANRALLEDQVAKWAADGTEFSLLVLDIDHFKAVNDTYGHRIGDEALHHLAQIMLSEAGQDDLCCRYGGEEFIVLLPNRSLSDGRALAERIRRKVENTISPTGKAITVSIGLACCPEHGKEFSQVFEQADHALYQAKRSGRNATISADQAVLSMN